MNNFSTGSVKALLFDLGGVVIDYDFNRVFASWADDSKCSIEEIQSKFTFDHAFMALERGEIEASEYYAGLRNMLDIDISDQQFESGWNTVYIGEIPGVQQLLRYANQRLPIYAFTNSNDVHKKVWSEIYADTLGLFRFVFNSSDIGRRKPEPEAFIKVSQAMGVDLPQIVFYDDFIENISGAQQVGLNTVHVRTIEDIKASFKKIFNTG